MDEAPGPPRVLLAEDFGYLYLPPNDVAERLRRFDHKSHTIEVECRIEWPRKWIDVRVDRLSWTEEYDLVWDPDERINRATGAQGPLRKPEKDEGSIAAAFRTLRVDSAESRRLEFGANWPKFVRECGSKRRLPNTSASGRTARDLGTCNEWATFIVAVDDAAELRLHLQASPMFQSENVEWVFVDNRRNRAFTSISRLYSRAARAARGEWLVYLHQDVFLPAQWESQVVAALVALHDRDPNFGVVGVAGRAPRSPGVPDPPNIGHWSDPHKYHEPTVPLPAEVQILDELLMIVRADSGLSFDPDLPGFHCYGADLCLSARDKGMKNYVIDAPVVHKLFRPDGSLIETGDKTHKIASRQTPEFRADFMRSADYVRRKWAKYLPFEGTSYRWE